MRRSLPFLVLGAVALCIVAAVLTYFLPSISFFLVPGEIKQAVADSLDCGDGTCAAINVRVKQAPVDATDQQNGIEARWCVAYVRIEQNTGSYTRDFLPWAYQTAKSYRFILEKTRGSYEPVSYGRGSDGDPERYDQYCR
jgi:hypothetical protein